MGRQLAYRLKQSYRGLDCGLDWGLAVSAAILMVAGAGIVPAQADQIESWYYDSQGRSLTLVLPTNVAPVLSVLAPNRLLVELPNTQVGDVAAQTVADGVVESIVLEQTDPDTVWMVVEFAPGTVLADAQSAVQINTDSTEPNNSQRWQVQPILAGSADSSPTTPSALALSPAADLAQAPDFPDLPLLEPALPISVPVSVPLIETVQPVAPTAVEPTQPEVNRTVDEPLPTAFMPAEAPIPTEADLLERFPEADLPVVDQSVTDQPTAESLEPDEPVADEPVADEPVADSREAAIVSQPEVPLEPPFLEGVAGAAAAMPEVPAAPAESIATVPPTAAAPATPTAAPVEAPLLEIPAERVSPANVSRWPEPIPFGQPLP